MNTVAVTGLLILTVNLATGAPLQNPFYKNLTLKCQGIENSPDILNSKILDRCNNTNFSEDNGKLSNTVENAFCILFFNSLVSFCNNSAPLGKDVVLPKFTSIPVDQLCADFNINELSNGAFTNQDCTGFCKTQFFNDICLASYYLSKVHKPQNKTLGVSPTKSENLETNDNQSGITTTQLSNSNSIKETNTGIKSEPIASKTDVKITEVHNRTSAEKTPIISEAMAKPTPEIKSKTEVKVEAPPVEPALKTQVVLEGSTKTPEKQESKKPETNVPLIDKSQDMVEPPLEEEEQQSKDPEEDLDDNEDALQDISSKQSDNKGPQKSKITEQESIYATEEMDGDSYFFSYFMVICLLIVLGYVGYHNRQKLFALVIEGKRGKRQYRGRRPNSANYHKLDSNLEEAITSDCSKNTSHVIY